jgi:uncharacterized protein (TIGR03437 family)
MPIPALQAAAVLSGKAVAAFNAASFAKDKVNGNLPDDNSIAPDSIVAVFGNFVTQNNQAFNAMTQPLPTVLGGVTASINGNRCGLLFVGPTQINLVVSALVFPGQGEMAVTNNDGSVRIGMLPVASFGPGIFAYNSAGTGLPSASTTLDGFAYQSVVNADGSAHAIDPGTPQRPNRLVLFGTAWRRAPIGSVRVALQGVPCTVEYAGPAPGFAGLDQANVVIPPQLSGAGNVSIAMSVVVNGSIVGRPANVNAQGPTPIIRKDRHSLMPELDCALSMR